MHIYSFYRKWLLNFTSKYSTSKYLLTVSIQFLTRGQTAWIGNPTISLFSSEELSLLFSFKIYWQFSMFIHVCLHCQSIAKSEIWVNYSSVSRTTVILERLRSALLCHDGCIASKKRTLFLKIEILLNNFSSFCAKDDRRG